MMSTRSLAWTFLLCGLAATSIGAQQWPHYAGDQAASHYSPLDQITTANVSTLAIAWEWKPNEKVWPQFGTRPGAFQNTPLDMALSAFDARDGREDTALVAFALEK